MKKETLTSLGMCAQYQAPVKFIHGLLAAGVPMEQINVNDFSSNPYPAVYVHNARIPWRARKYHRWNSYTLEKARLWWQSAGKTPYISVS